MTLSSDDLGKLVAGRSITPELAKLLRNGDVVLIPSDFGDVELEYVGHDGATHLVAEDGEQYVVFFDLTEVLFVRPAQREAQPERLPFNPFGTGLSEPRLTGAQMVCGNDWLNRQSAQPEPDGGGEVMTLEPGVPWAGDDPRWDDVTDRWRKHADEQSDEHGRSRHCSPPPVCPLHPHPRGTDRGGGGGCRSGRNQTLDRHSFPQGLSCRIGSVGQWTDQTHPRRPLHCRRTMMEALLQLIGCAVIAVFGTASISVIVRRTPQDIADARRKAALSTSKGGA